jgi:endonuclease YncB( thermonuclease family)
MTLAAHLRAFVLGVILGLAPPAYGEVRVIDGDTLKLSGTTYRLHGIDAPELHQTCGGWIAGEYAAAVLRGLLNDRSTIVCIPRSTDRYGRTVAICLADGVDVGAEMVRRGMAWAFTRYSTSYVDLEDAARADGLGVHAAHCRPAWDFRKEKR